MPAEGDRAAGCVGPLASIALNGPPMTALSLPFHRDWIRLLWRSEFEIEDLVEIRRGTDADKVSVRNA
jgi:hypothetical protein